MFATKNFLITFSFIFSLFLLIYSSNFSCAGGLLESQEGFGAGGVSSVSQVFNGGSAPQDIRMTIAKIIHKVLGFVGIIFFILILYSGFLWMTAGGNETKVEESKKYISRSVIGLIIILSAYSISNFVIECVLNASGNVTFGCFY